MLKESLKEKLIMYIYINITWILIEMTIETKTAGVVGGFYL